MKPLATNLRAEYCPQSCVQAWKSGYKHDRNVARHLGCRLMRGMEPEDSAKLGQALSSRLEVTDAVLICYAAIDNSHTLLPPKLFLFQYTCFFRFSLFSTLLMIQIPKPKVSLLCQIDTGATVFYHPGDCDLNTALPLGTAASNLCPFLSLLLSKFCLF